MGPGEHGEKTGIWIINVLTATPRQIRGNAEAAVPSPDGTVIGFRTSTGEPQISVVDASGENVRVLVTATLNENFGAVRWSPDGKRLGFVVHRLGDPMVSIDTVDVAGGKRAELTRQEHLRTFAWLPDGRIVFTVATAQVAGAGSLYLLDRRGNKRQLEIGAGLTVADMSATVDGKRLAVIRASEQSDVYVAGVTKNGFAGEPRRVTLDDRDDRPSGWLPDNATLLFDSDRNGTFDVFRQRAESNAAELLASGPDQQFGAETTPDGSAILYWSAAENSDRMRLMSIPASGGPATTVLEAPRQAQFHCAKTCVMAVPEKDHVSLRELNPSDGTSKPLQDSPVQLAARESLLWALARDGGQVAYVNGRGVRVVDLRSGATWEVPETSLNGKPSGVAFSSTPGELIVTTTTSRESQVLLVSRTEARKLWTATRQVFAPVPSPDGKQLLLGITTATSNAWLVEGF